MRSSAALMQAGAQMVKLEGGGWTAPNGALPRRARRAGVRAPGPHAAERARARRLPRAGPRASRRGARCARRRASWPTPAPRCWCWSWCRRRWRRRVRAATARRCVTIGIGAGAGTRGPGAGAARHARHHAAASCRASCATSPRAPAASSAALRRYVAAVKDGSFPDDPSTATEAEPCAPSTPSPNCAPRWPARARPPSCRPWATCTRATCRWCAQARAHGGPVVASIFVNRLQFAPHEDFDRYPRTLAARLRAAAGRGLRSRVRARRARAVPEPQTFKVVPDPALADILEGEFRPGFFTGVCTVVMKLFQACARPWPCSARRTTSS